MTTFSLTTRTATRHPEIDEKFFIVARVQAINQPGSVVVTARRDFTDAWRRAGYTGYEDLTTEQLLELITETARKGKGLRKAISTIFEKGQKGKWN